MRPDKNQAMFRWAFAAAVLAAVSGCSGPGGGTGSGPAGSDWVLMDESYVPKDDVEAYIKTDAENRGSLPLYIRNYGADRKALGRFKGRQYAGPSVSALEMLNPGLGDWMIVDIKYKVEGEREVVRTVLYLSVGGVWKVGDSGTLLSS